MITMTSKTSNSSKGGTRHLVSLSLLILMLGVFLVLFTSLFLSLYWVSAWSFTTLVLLFGLKFIYDDYRETLIILEEAEERLSEYQEIHFLSKGHREI